MEPALEALEIYEYPDDCFTIELRTYFKDDLQSTDDLFFYEQTRTFIMKVTESVAVKILRKPEKYLDEVDRGSMIKMRPFLAERQVVLTSTEDISIRFLRKYLKHSNIETYRKGKDSGQIILTLRSSKETDDMTYQGNLYICDLLTVKVNRIPPPNISASNLVRPDSPGSTTSTRLTLDSKEDFPLPNISKDTEENKCVIVGERLKQFDQGKSRKTHMYRASPSIEEMPFARHYSPQSTISHRVLAETEASLPFSVLKKFMKSKYQGTITKKVKDKIYLVEFADGEAAKRVVEQGILLYKEDKITVRHLNVSEMSEGSYEISDANNEALIYTHIEVDKHKSTPSDEMFQLLELHFEEVLGEEWSDSHTPFQHSYDEVQQVYRFDMSPADISKLTSSVQYLQDGDPSSVFRVQPKPSGKLARVKVHESSDQMLNKEQLDRFFGSRGPFRSQVTIHSCDAQSAVMEMESCSVTSRLVSIGKHTLGNQMVVEVSFNTDGDVDGSPSTTLHNNRAYMYMKDPPQCELDLVTHSDQGEETVLCNGILPNSTRPARVESATYASVTSIAPRVASELPSYSAQEHLEGTTVDLNHNIACRGSRGRESSIVSDGDNFSATHTATLPSGVVCNAGRGDITSLNCDALLNATNCDLQLVNSSILQEVNAGLADAEQTYVTRMEDIDMEVDPDLHAKGAVSSNTVKPSEVGEKINRTYSQALTSEPKHPPQHVMLPKTTLPNVGNRQRPKVAPRPNSTFKPSAGPRASPTGCGVSRSNTLPTRLRPFVPINSKESDGWVAPWKRRDEPLAHQGQKPGASKPRYTKSNTVDRRKKYEGGRNEGGRNEGVRNEGGRNEGDRNEGGHNELEKEFERRRKNNAVGSEG